MENKKRINEIIKRLLKKYPAPNTALKFASPFELLVATILSAQSTDVQVNKLTPALFKKYKTVKDFVAAPLEELERGVNTVNFYRNKAKNIKAAAMKIMESFGGKVPKTMDELITLPGVARKTANIVLSGAFGVIDGIAVDTHVIRLSGRLGLSKNADPAKIERDLMAITPKDRWFDLSNLLILHGRNVCKAVNPEHDKCVLADICPSRDV